MISQETDTPGRASVIGSLTGDAVQVLLDAVDGGLAVLDLSEVDQVDDAAVRVLARLRAGRCTLLGCPRWLELWLARVRDNPGF
jgi:anti-anti-sigma regulatory factor